MGVFGDAGLHYVSVRVPLCNVRVSHLGSVTPAALLSSDLALLYEGKHLYVTEVTFISEFSAVPSHSTIDISSTAIYRGINCVD